MVRFILVCCITFLISPDLRADFLGFNTDEDSGGRIPAITEKLKNLEMEEGPAYEDKFNQLVKSLEQTLEEEKLYCSGESANAAGKVLPKEKKQLCFRELKAHYLEAQETIFNLKKKYLGLIHNRQIEKLTEIQKKLRSDIDKSF